ncbi:MAG TPA: hypothetical protein DCE42_02670 [Myxococcales bacterium]|nr:hypothetical protein [Deltaproteobacteria bacterium]MBU53823.1 hypothetical protein [Deltaproteobacteria bacterium]HAA53629.1 hypothetical protein [Myxococcales bacterium]|tara:strand:- start:4065 stop:4280 length:216 start_codon:yes stop_codon:yes gene_type:complete
MILSFLSIYQLCVGAFTTVKVVFFASFLYRSSQHTTLDSKGKVKDYNSKKIFLMFVMDCGISLPAKALCRS